MKALFVFGLIAAAMILQMGIETRRQALMVEEVSRMSDTPASLNEKDKAVFCRAVISVADKFVADGVDRDVAVRDATSYCSFVWKSQGNAFQ